LVFVGYWDVDNLGRNCNAYSNLFHGIAQSARSERMKEERCETCRYWKNENISRNESGHCRRHPPIKSKEFFVYASYPLTKIDYWCGEYERAERKGEK